MTEKRWVARTFDVSVCVSNATDRKQLETMQQEIMFPIYAMGNKCCSPLACCQLPLPMPWIGNHWQQKDIADELTGDADKNAL